MKSGKPGLKRSFSKDFANIHYRIVISKLFCQDLSQDYPQVPKHRERVTGYRFQSPSGCQDS